jgi:hypothetical protein
MAHHGVRSSLIQPKPPSAKSASENAIGVLGIDHPLRIDGKLAVAHQPADIRPRDADALGIGVGRNSRHDRVNPA